MVVVVTKVMDNLDSCNIMKKRMRERKKERVKKERKKKVVGEKEEKGKKKGSYSLCSFSCNLTSPGLLQQGWNAAHLLCCCTCSFVCDRLNPLYSLSF